MTIKGKEQFKDVKGYEGLYEVSNRGRIFSHYGKGKILSECKTSSGYKLVQLVKDGIKKDFNVHRLVANEFIDNPLGKRCVNHIDGNKTNNSVDNLEWVTDRENIQHAIRTGLYAGISQSDAIRGAKKSAESRKRSVACYKDGNLVDTYGSITSAMESTGCNHINDVISGKRNIDHGFTWRYL
jgi:hypothetical protein